MEIILKAFREESFSHRGKHYTLPPEVPYRGYSLKEITPLIRCRAMNSRPRALPLTMGCQISTG